MNDFLSSPCASEALCLWKKELLLPFNHKLSKNNAMKSYLPAGRFPQTERRHWDLQAPGGPERNGHKARSCLVTPGGVPA